MYDSPVQVSSFSPTSGPASGDTRVVVSGSMLSHGLEYTCTFGENGTVAAEYNRSEGTVICLQSPRLPPGDHAFSISLDGIHAARGPQPFTFYEGVASSLAPTGGPVLGGTTILVQGNGLSTGSDYRCNYDDVVFTPDGPHEPHDAQA